ncbi:hypothetical protein [Streptomyces sp. NPDC020917]|uniref:hypothetical protein n=1 Tax=Streptomyces sp. NPDC020917 TaxID=3365102 RepID=UPI0037ACCE2B
MTRRLRALALLPAAALAAAVLAGCAHHDASAGSDQGGASPSAPSASQLAHMQKLVDGADSAASAAEKDASADK